MTDRLLNAAEVARRLNVSRSTIFAWVYQRRVPFVKLARGRALRFRECDVKRIIADGLHEPEEIRVDIRP